MAKHILVYKYEAEGYIVVDGEKDKGIGIANAFADSVRDKVAECGHELCSDIEVAIRDYTPNMLEVVEDCFNERTKLRVISNIETKS